MRPIFVFLFLAITTCSLAQTDQQQINDQVWKPFTKAIMTQDVDVFASLHSNDLVRAEISRKKVMDLKEYHQGMKSGWPAWKESIKKDKLAYTFELRFLDRISNGTSAYEIGYFKNETTDANGKKQIGYGKFHVVLRKENGVWKILVDSDSNEGGKITEEMFQAAQAIQ